MIEIRLQVVMSEAAFPQCFAVARMLLQHVFIARNSQVTRGESLGKIASRDTNNGMLEHYRPSLSEFVVNEFGCSDVLNRDADRLEHHRPVSAVKLRAVQQLANFGTHLRMRKNNVSRLFHGSLA